jgi:hypothetical protein
MTDAESLTDHLDLGNTECLPGVSSSPHLSNMEPIVILQSNESSNPGLNVLETTLLGDPEIDEGYYIVEVVPDSLKEDSSVNIQGMINTSILPHDGIFPVNIDTHFKILPIILAFQCFLESLIYSGNVKRKLRCVESVKCIA